MRPDFERFRAALMHPEVRAGLGIHMSDFEAGRIAEDENLAWAYFTNWRRSQEAAMQLASEPFVMERQTAPTAPTVYWANLFRFRTWWFAVPGMFIITVVLVAIGVPAPIAWIIWVGLAALSLWTSLHTQMACRACGRTLAVTRLTGQPEVCRHCQTPTDRAIRAASQS